MMTIQCLNIDPLPTTPNRFGVVRRLGGNMKPVGTYTAGTFYQNAARNFPDVRVEIYLTKFDEPIGLVFKGGVLLSIDSRSESRFCKLVVLTFNPLIGRRLLARDFESRLKGLES